MRRFNLSALVALGLAIAPAATAQPSAPPSGAAPAGAKQEETHGYPDCTRQPTDAETAAAKGAFQAGQAAFNEADYTRAIDYWEDAYRRDCTAHALLLNLGRAFELNGQKRQAVLALETYLVRKADAPQRDQIERRIEVLNSQVAREEAVQPSPQPLPTPAPAPTPTPEPPVNDEAPRGQRSIVPLIVAGAGGAIALTGGILYAKARSDLSDAKDRCPGGTCPTTAAADDANSTNTRVNVTGGIGLGGLAIAAGGLVWYFVSKPTVEAPKAAVTRHRALPSFSPAVGKNFTGFALSGSF